MSASGRERNTLEYRMLARGHERRRRRARRSDHHTGQERISNKINSINLPVTSATCVNKPIRNDRLMVKSRTYLVAAYPGIPGFPPLRGSCHGQETPAVGCIHSDPVGPHIGMRI